MASKITIQIKTNIERRIKRDDSAEWFLIFACFLGTVTLGGRGD